MFQQIYLHDQWTGDWIGPRTGLDMMAKRKILASVRKRTLGV